MATKIRAVVDPWAFLDLQCLRLKMEAIKNKRAIYKSSSSSAVAGGVNQPLTHSGHQLASSSRHREYLLERLACAMPVVPGLTTPPDLADFDYLLLWKLHRMHVHEIPETTIDRRWTQRARNDAAD